MHKVARLFALEWSTMLQYRFDLILWVLTEAATPLISLVIWYTVSQSGSFALSSQDTLTYYILIIFVIVATSAWNGFFFSRQILNGEITFYLTRPLSIFWRHIANNIVEKVIKFIIPVPLVVITAVVFPAVFSPAIYDPWRLLLFTISLILGTAVAFVLDMNLGILAFWLEDANQLRRYKDLLHEVSSGILIPFAALPAVAFTIFSFLPFRYVISVPIEILMNQQLDSLGKLFGLQIAWLVGLTALLALLWRRGLKRYAVPTQ
ncbi:MAG: ABC-2 family transporter protein [Candidatus Andersenbacteria bacterium]